MLMLLSIYVTVTGGSLFRWVLIGGESDRICMAKRTPRRCHVAAPFVYSFASGEVEAVRHHLVDDPAALHVQAFLEARIGVERLHAVLRQREAVGQGGVVERVARGQPTS